MGDGAGPGGGAGIAPPSVVGAGVILGWEAGGFSGGVGGENSVSEQCAVLLPFGGDGYGEVGIAGVASPFFAIIAHGEIDPFFFVGWVGLTDVFAGGDGLEFESGLRGAGG